VAVAVRVANVLVQQRSNLRFRFPMMRLPEVHSAPVYTYLFTAVLRGGTGNSVPATLSTRLVK
jgi:hypothetical protein